MIKARPKNNVQDDLMIAIMESDPLLPSAPALNPAYVAICNLDLSLYLQPYLKSSRMSALESPLWSRISDRLQSINITGNAKAWNSALYVVFIFYRGSEFYAN